MSGILLLITAYYHSTGLAGLKEAISAVQFPEFFAAAVPVQWLFFSWHLSVLAVPLIWAASANPGWFLPATIFGGVVVFGDFLWVFSIAGWFPGTVILLLVAAFLGAASVLQARANRVTDT